MNKSLYVGSGAYL